MARAKRGNIRIELNRDGDQLKFRAVHTGPAGKQTLSRFELPYAERKEGKKDIERWMSNIHPRIKLSEETSE